MSAPVVDLIITRGKTLAHRLAISDSELVYRDITALSSLAPARVTVAGHGVPTGWPVRIEGVKAPVELNTPVGQWWLPAVLSADSLEFNALNLLRARTFAGPAVLVYPKPADLSTWQTVRAQVRDKIGGEVLLSFSSSVPDGADGTISIDIAASAITLGLTAEQSAALTWRRAVYDVEVVLADGSVLPVVAPSAVTVEQEVTVWA